MAKTSCSRVISGSISLAACLLLFAPSFPAGASPASPALIATPAQPTWSELTTSQKIVLAPLCDNWDSMESHNQKKWLNIVVRFYELSTAEQRRIQSQMQEWGRLTPEERRMARENFKTASQLPAKKKEELKQKWEEYSSLPETEKEKLKQQAKIAAPIKPALPVTQSPPLPTAHPPQANPEPSPAPAPTMSDSQSGADSVPEEATAP